MKLRITGKKFSFTNVLSWTIEYRMYLKFLQKPRCLGWLNKVKFLERQFHSKKLLFLHKKETECSFELSLSIGVFYRCIFNLEMQNFSLENHHMMNAHQPFCWWMTFTKVSYLLLPPPPKWFFSAGYYFSQVFLYKLFSPRNQSAGCFFSEITRP